MGGTLKATVVQENTSSVPNLTLDSSGNIVVGARQLISGNPVAERVLLNTLTASNSAVLQDTTSLITGYPTYEVVFENIVCSSTAANFRVQVQSGGAWQTTSYLCGCAYTGGSGVAATTVTVGVLLDCGTNSSMSYGGVNGYFRMINPASTTAYKSILGTSSNPYIGYWNFFGGHWQGATGATAAVTGLQFSFSAGNIVSGTIKIYGVK